MDLLNETLRAWAMQREFRSVLNELKSYSDRELTELGLSRGDIARVAYQEAERRIVTPAKAQSSGSSGPPPLRLPARLEHSPGYPADSRLTARPIRPGT